MKIETALKRRDILRNRLKESYSRAIHFRWTSKELGEESRLVRGSLSAPQWVRAYVEGAESVMRDNLYSDHLEYCSRIDGRLVSHYRKSPRYYEKLGYSPRALHENGTHAGHYWVDTDCPFFADDS